MEPIGDTAVLTELQKAKQWVRHEMAEGKWVPITDKQREVFKDMMLEWYGWPVFSLNFNKAMNCVMKIKL